MAPSLIVPHPLFRGLHSQNCEIKYSKINAFFILKSKLFPFFTFSTLKINLQNSNGVWGQVSKVAQDYEILNFGKNMTFHGNIRFLRFAHLNNSTKLACDIMQAAF